MNLLMIQNILPLFKNFLFLLGILALSFLPSISPASAATTKNAASADPVYQRTFDQLMDNEWISHIYFRLQQNLLSSHSDHEFSQFIASSPLLIKMRESFLSQQEYLLEKVLYRASQNMETVVPGKKYFDKSIDFLLVQAARDLGFSPNSIANRKIYLDYRDPDNAASLSLSPDQITVVIGANLARQTPPENLRSLLGHELAHSLSFHGANRHIENLLNAFLLEVFTRGLPSSFDRRDLIRMVNTVGRLYQDQSPLCHSGRRAVLEELGRNFRNKSAEKSQLVLEGLGLINQLPRHEIKKLLTSFLETLVRRSQLEKNYENADYFERLILLDPYESRVDLVNSSILEDHLLQSSRMLFRSQEYTADRYGSVITSTLTMAKTIGTATGLIQSGGDPLAQLQATVKKAISKNKTTNQEIQKDELISSHPDPLARIETLLTLSPDANWQFSQPIFKLFVLEEAMRFHLDYPNQDSQVGEKKQILKDLQNQLIEFLLNPISVAQGSDSNKSDSSFEKFIDFICKKMMARREYWRKLGKAEIEIKRLESSIVGRNRILKTLKERLSASLEKVPFWNGNQRESIASRLEILNQISQFPEDSHLQTIAIFSSRYSQKIAGSKSTSPSQSTSITNRAKSACRQMLLGLPFSFGN